MKMPVGILSSMEGQLKEHPLGELIREVTHAALSGALRVARGPAKVVVYFLAGETVFAASNLRTHRLREALKRAGIPGTQLATIPTTASEDELAEAVVKSAALTREELQNIRSRMVQDALRTALLWPDGSWTFDPRVRVAEDLRMKVDVNQLLLECARHLPLAFVKSRFDSPNASYSVARAGHTLNLTSAEEFIVSRAIVEETGINSADLGANGLSEEESLRSVYGLSLAGALVRTEWPAALTSGARRKTSEAGTGVQQQKGTEAATNNEPETAVFLERLRGATDYFEVLGVSQAATMQEIKDCYHVLARNFHPDRFHQGPPELRNEIESAFARLAQAYETLSDSSLRASYEKQLLAKAAPAGSNPKGAADRNLKSAEISFRQGMEALQDKRPDDAIRFLAQAAHLAPREALYRAHYGSALAQRPNSRRTAESELHAALAIEPNNATFRLMLAELYRTAGLRRRAQNEAARALAADPKNEAARALLSSLNVK